MELERENPVTQHLRFQLNCWLDIANFTKGKSLQQHQNNCNHYTDASNTGYGGYMGNQFVQRIRSVAQKKTTHKRPGIGSIFLTLNHFQSVLKGQKVLIRSDSTTV